MNNHFTYLPLQLHLVAVLRGVGLLSQAGEVVVAKVSIFLFLEDLMNINLHCVLFLQVALASKDFKLRPEKL